MHLILLDKGQTILNPVYIKKVEFDENPDKSGIVNLYMDDDKVIRREYTKENYLQLWMDIMNAMKSVNE